MLKKKYYKIEQRDNLLIEAVISHVCLMACKNIVVQVSYVLLQKNALLNMLVLGIVFLLYLRAFVFSYNHGMLRLPRNSLLIIVSLVFFVLITLLIEPNRFFSSETKDEIRTFLCYGLPLFVALSCVVDISRFPDKLMRWGTPMFIVATASFLVSRLTGWLADPQGYSMPYGYGVLWISIVLLIRFQKHRSNLDVVMFLLTIIYIIRIGSRGPLLFILVAMVAFFLRETPKRKLCWVVLGSFIILLIWCLYPFYVEYIKGSFTLGRTLNMLRSGRFFSDSGRNELHRSLLRMVSQSPIIGLGAFAGTLVSSAHGIFFDIIANFGYLGGMLFFLVITISIIRVYKKASDKDVENLLVFLTVLSFSGSFFNGGFFTTKELWILFGVLISFSRIERKKGYEGLC